MITKLALRNFRSYDEKVFEFTEGVNVITGPNGVGKTNILEAIYVLFKGTSFRVPLKETIKHEKEWFRIDVTGDRDYSFRFHTVKRPFKRLFIDEAPATRSKAEMPRVVLFEPDFMRILNGSPTRRRAYLDYIASEWFEEAKAVLRRYERVLLQRNNLLRQSEGFISAGDRDQLFVWNVMLAQAAAKIEGWRIEIIDHFNSQLSDIYSAIAGEKTDIEVHYSLKHTPSEQELLAQLQAHEPIDARRGHTTVGPHRHDFSANLNGSPITSSASRGEIRSLSIALKKLEIHQHELAGREIIVLFDDIFSELDENRQASLLEVHEKHQLIITTPHIDTLAHRKGVNHLAVR